MSAAECAPPQVSDEDLVAQVLAGEADGFDILYERYLRRIYRFVEKRVRNRSDAEDTTQEVFVNVFSSLGSFRGEAPFAAWVLGIARRTVAGRFKRKQHPTVPLDASEEPAGYDDLLPTTVHRAATPHELYECAERIARLESTAARQLSAEQRRLFELHHLEHRSITDIAAILDKSEDAVKSNLYRTRKLLLAR